MAFFTIRCNCGQTLRVPESRQGQQVRCPGCRAVLVAHSKARVGMPTLGRLLVLLLAAIGAGYYFGDRIKRGTSADTEARETAEPPSVASAVASRAETASSVQPDAPQAEKDRAARTDINATWEQETVLVRVATAVPGPQRTGGDAHAARQRGAGALDVAAAIRLAQRIAASAPSDDAPFLKARLENAAAGAEHAKAITNSGGMPLLQVMFRASNMFCARDNGFNKDATSAAFAAAVENLDERKMTHAIGLCGLEGGQHLRLVVLALLLGSSGEFVNGPGRVNTAAFDTALNHIAADTVKGVAETTRVARADALLAMLRSAAHYVDAQGRFQPARFDGALGAVTADHVSSVMSATGRLDRAEALYLLLRASAVGAAGQGPEAPASSVSTALTEIAYYTNSIGMKFVKVPAGEFMMGSQEHDSEKPVHRVRIAKDFYLGAYEVTQAQWESVMGNNPSHFKGRNKPVERVSWNDCQEFLKRLCAKEGVPEGTYRLPTEAEWEYACRAGSRTRFYSGDDDSDFGRIAWYSGNSGRQTHEVGRKLPNAFGVYDMHGNVLEWCQSMYRPYPYRADDGREFLGGGDRRVLRGGSWNFIPWGCRSAHRNYSAPAFSNYLIGFRVVFSPRP